MRILTLLLTLVFAAPVSAGCFALGAITGLSPVSIAQVYDGDTLKLTDGRKVRLLNINTPELGRNGSPDEPLARQATEQAKQWLSARDRLFLLFDTERKDRYGRQLAHVLDNRGESLAEYLLVQGLAVPLAVPPNLEKAACYFNLAIKPKHAKWGVWAINGAIAASRLSRSGFQRVSGTISKITKTRAGDYWLELQGQLAIQVRKQDLGYFEAFPTGYALGSKIEVTGWVVGRSKSPDVKRKGYAPWTLQVRTPYAITVIAR